MDFSSVKYRKEVVYLVVDGMFTRVLLLEIGEKLPKKTE